MSVTSHTCNACNGNGWRDSLADPKGADACRTDLLGLLACPVCAGSGNISDRVTVVQAMADAARAAFHAVPKLRGMDTGDFE